MPSATWRRRTGRPEDLAISAGNSASGAAVAAACNAAPGTIARRLAAPEEVSMKGRREIPTKKADEETRSLADLVRMDEPTTRATAATVVAGVAIAVLQPELLPGLAIGAGAALSPKLLPAAGRAVRFVAKAVIRAGFQVAHATQEIVAEAGEEVRDLVAEARPEAGPSRTRNNAV